MINVRGREKFAKYGGIIKLVSKAYSVFNPKIQAGLFARSRKKVGNLGYVVRYCLLKNLACSVGDNVSIFPDVYIMNANRLSIGDNVSIHPMCYIECVGDVTIGNDVSIAEGTSIISFDHKFDNIHIPIKEQGIVNKPICIDDDVWIGAKATILGGVHVGRGAIVAAGAVVTKDVEDYTIVAGVPAIPIKDRLHENISNNEIPLAEG